MAVVGFKALPKNSILDLLFLEYSMALYISNPGKKIWLDLKSAGTKVDITDLYSKNLKWKMASLIDPSHLNLSKREFLVKSNISLLFLTFGNFLLILSNQSKSVWTKTLSGLTYYKSFSVLLANKSDEFKVPIKCNSLLFLGSVNKTWLLEKDENLSIVGWS